MSNFFDLLKTRRSVRKFTSEKVTPSDVKQIISAALMAPSSRKTSPWEFIVIQNNELIASLSDSRLNGSQFVAEAPLIIVVAADETLTDVWFEDCAIASTLIQLQAHDLGLGSCWIQVYKRMKSETLDSETYIRNLLQMPNNYRILNLIAIGHPDEKKDVTNVSELQLNKIHYEHF